jgi:hypothetical protein
MQRTDKFLVAIVIGIVVLVGAGFTFMLLRPRPSYQPDNTPYLLALHQADYKRAYLYLSPYLPGYPENLAEFERGIRSYAYSDFNAASEVISNVRTWADDRATVSIVQTKFYQRGLFGSETYEYTFEMELEWSAGQWRITRSGVYWPWCFENEAGC